MKRWWSPLFQRETQVIRGRGKYLGEVTQKTGRTRGERSGPAEDQGGFVLVCTGLVSHSPNLRGWSWWWWWRRWYSHPDFQVMTSSVMISVCDPYWVWACSTGHRSRLTSVGTSVRVFGLFVNKSRNWQKKMVLGLQSFHSQVILIW